MKQLESKYCVVGAGYAGLAAAYRLHQKGHSVTVLEAGSHAGGRVWTEHLSDGTPFDIGGAWVGTPKVQREIRELMKELKVTTYGQYTAGPNGRTTFVDSNGKVSYYEPLSEDKFARLPKFRDELAQLDLGTTVLALNAMSKVVNVEMPWEDVDLPPYSDGAATTREADRMTVQAWLDRNMISTDAKTLLSNAITGIFGVNASAASLLHLLFMLKTFDSDFAKTIGSGKDEAEQFRVFGGAQTMARKIAAILGDALHMGSPVRQITQDKNGVTVSTEEVSVRAKRVIVATGTAMANFIRFDPVLPPARALLQQRMPQGECWKIWLCYDRAFWRDTDKHLNGESVSIRKGDLVVNSRDAGVVENEPGLMNAFLAGDGAAEFDRMSRKDRKERVLRELVHRFGKEAGKLSKKITFPAILPQNPKPDSYFEWNWAMDEFTRGDFAAVPGPGVYTNLGFGPAMREPFGRVHWASVDLATRPYASFSGAVQSGERTAKDVMELD
jgi:monoamine oxidase